MGIGLTIVEHLMKQARMAVSSFSVIQPDVFWNSLWTPYCWLKTTCCLGKASSASLSPMVINAFGCRCSESVSLVTSRSRGAWSTTWKTATAYDTCLIGYCSCLYQWSCWPPKLKFNNVAEGLMAGAKDYVISLLNDELLARVITQLRPLGVSHLNYANIQINLSETDRLSGWKSNHVKNLKSQPMWYRLFRTKVVCFTEMSCSIKMKLSSLSSTRTVDNQYTAFTSKATNAETRNASWGWLSFGWGITRK